MIIKTNFGQLRHICDKNFKKKKKGTCQQNFVQEGGHSVERLSKIGCELFKKGGNR